MTEAYTTLENTMLYYGNADQTRHGAHFSFNFILITDLNVDSSAQDFVNAVKKWMKVMPSQYTANWVVCNLNIQFLYCFVKELFVQFVFVIAWKS